jgi:hypothetical protein
MRRAVAGLAACALLFGGDAAFAGKKPKKPPPPRECTADHNTLPVTNLEQLLTKRKGVVLFNEKSPCLSRQGQPPLPAAVLELPKFEAPYILRIESLISGSFVMPRVEMLGADGTVTRVIEAGSFRKRTTVVSVDVFMKPENAGETRVLLFPDPAEIGKSEQRTVMSMQSTYIYTGTWNSGTDTTQNLQQVDEGRLTVLLVGDAWDDKGRRR